METIFNSIGIISSWVLLIYVFFGRTKAIVEVFEDDTQESTKSFIKNVGWITWLFTGIAAVSFF